MLNINVYVEERKYYDTLASQVNELFELELWEKPIWNHILNEVGTLKGKKVLDLACGFGREAIWFAKKGADVTAVDISKVIINKAKNHAHQNRVNIDFKTKNVDHLNYSEEFDIVYCRASLHHFLDPLKILKRSHQFLKQDGIMIAQEPKKLNVIATIGRALIKRSTKTEHPFNNGDLEDMFSTVFSQVKMKYYCIFSPAYLVFMWIKIVNDQLFFVRQRKLQKMIYSLLNPLDKLLLKVPFMENFAWIQLCFGMKIL
ncbi:methyltransferase [subsurface metagenome]